MEQSLIFGDVNSSDYGIFISGAGVFNAPKRDVKTFSIPGRNGDFLLDRNRFENITVTYPAHCKAPDLATFREQLSAYRNALTSQKGYQRLEDTINGSEYRLGAFVGGFEAEPIGYSTSATFDLVFDCKPQRYLKVGELPVAITSGDTLTNPTLFESKPLLMVEGYGTLDIGEDSVRVDYVEVGDILLSNGVPLKDTTTGDLSSEVTVGTIKFDSSKLNTGDAFWLQPTEYTVSVTDGTSLSSQSYVEAGVRNMSGTGVTTASVISSRTALYVTNIPALGFQKGTAKTVSNSCILDFTKNDGGSSESSSPFGMNIVYDGAGTITITARHYTPGRDTVQTSGMTGELKGHSSLLASGTIYIDLDIGEAYWVKDGVVISANYSVYLGADLPTLKPGSNTITFPNTFTKVEIIPRWWRI